MISVDDEISLQRMGVMQQKRNFQFVTIFVIDVQGYKQCLDLDAC